MHKRKSNYNKLAISLLLSQTGYPDGSTSLLLVMNTLDSYESFIAVLAHSVLSSCLSPFGGLWSAPIICAHTRSTYLHTASSYIHFLEVPPPLKESPQGGEGWEKFYKYRFTAAIEIRKHAAGWSQVSAPDNQQTSILIKLIL